MLDEDDAVGVVRRLLEPLASGSYLAMSIGTADFAPEEVGRVAREYAARNMPMRLRTLEEAHEFFEGLELVEPGIVQVHKWHLDGTGEAGDPGRGHRDVRRGRPQTLTSRPPARPPDGPAGPGAGVRPTSRTPAPTPSHGGTDRSPPASVSPCTPPESPGGSRRLRTPCTRS